MQSVWFQKSHSTDICNFVLNESIHYYNSLGSSVFACFIDASKAFVRVNHGKLFETLRKNKIPDMVIRILQY